MTCIDSAIIKALVEHIGGNPDDVVIGGGGSTQNTYTKRTDVQFIDNNGKLAMKLGGDSTTYMKVGAVVRLHYGNGTNYRLLMVSAFPCSFVKVGPDVAYTYNTTIDSANSIITLNDISTTSVDLDAMNNNPDYGFFDYDMKVPTGEDLLSCMHYLNERIFINHPSM